MLLWMCVIFWMSTGTFSAQNTSLIIEPLLRFVMPSTTPEHLSLINGVIRKSAHVTEYFVLGILLFRAFRLGSEKLRTMRWAFYSFLIVVFYAAGDEFHQSFEAGRTASLLDVGFDTLGGFLAQAVTIVKLRRQDD
ncbi:MAG TPA: VanZ family protein [Candidatus Methanoperedens sp.]